MQICPTCGERNPDPARFCMTCGGRLAVGSAPAETRKVVTVFFMDVVGSTDIAEKLDPESVRELMQRYSESSRTLIEATGGTVEKFIGDAVMAVFGVPRVAEDDAFRAVRAAIEIRDQLSELDREASERWGVRFRVRIGVNTGEVVVGDPSKGHAFVSGDTVNVAARLEQAAPAQGILIGDATHKLVRDRIHAQPVEPLTLKGKSEPVPAFEATALRDSATDAPEYPLLADFVGRTIELARLHAALEHVRTEGRAERVLIQGESGIGKSRLLARFLQDQGEDPNADSCRTLEARCAPPGDRAPSALASLALEAAASANDLLAEMERGPFVRAGLGRAGEEDTNAESLQAIRLVCELLASEGVLTVFVDDVHWANTATELFLSDISSCAAPILIVTAARPDADRNPDPSETVIALDGLTDPDADALLVSLAPGAFSAPERDRLKSTASGNPFFLEQTIRMLIEDGAISPDPAAEGSFISSGLEQIEMPTSVQALLAARLDLLTPGERQIAECGSVVGRSFSVSDIRALAENLSIDALAASSSGLAAKQIIDPAASGAYRFHHALMREVVYGSMTKQRRAKLHEMLATGLEADFAVSAASVAFHLDTAYALLFELGVRIEERAPLGSRAAGWLAVAGERAMGVGDRESASASIVRARTLYEDCALAPGGVPSAPLAAKIAHGSLLLGDWSAVVELLGPLESFLKPDAMKDLGVALCKLHRGERHEEGFTRGQRLLEEAAQAARDPDAFSSLAGTYKGVDDERAHTLYRRALEIDGSDPYALGNHLEFEVRQRGPEALGELRGPIEEAVTRCRRQADARENLPWAFYDLGKFRLLTGDVFGALDSYGNAIRLSGGDYMIETSLASLDRLDEAVAALDGGPWIPWLLRLGLAARFGATAALSRVPRKPTKITVAGRAPVIIIAGGTSRDSESDVMRTREAILTSLEGSAGLILGGGTKQGVGALVGDLRAACPAALAIGYVPAHIPDGVEVEKDLSRYDEIRRTTGYDFSVEEPLACWTDLLASGVDAASVSLIGIGGGDISAAEYRIALALGARVGIVRGSGREADLMLGDADWAVSDRLIELKPTAASVSAFVPA